MTNASPTVEELIGKTILVGITRLNHREELVEQRQFAGTFVSMKQTICLRLTTGEDYTLPPDLSAFRKATPGVYRLRSTGDEVENPDFAAVWTVVEPAPNSTDEKV